MTERPPRIVISFDDVPDDPPRRAEPPLPHDAVRLVSPAARAFAAPVAPSPPADKSSAPPIPPLSSPPPRAITPAPASRLAGIPEWGYASWPRRAAAACVDSFVLFAGTLVLWALVGVAFSALHSSSPASLIGVLLAFFFISLALNLFYAPVLMARAGEGNGQTLGKQALGIRVLSLDDRPMTMGRGLVRDVVMKQLVFGGLGWFLLGIPLVLDYLWPLWEPRRRTLHDLSASTVVVKDEVVDQLP